MSSWQSFSAVPLNSVPTGQKPYSLSLLFSIKLRGDNKHCFHLGQSCTINLFLSLLPGCGSGSDCGFLKSEKEREKRKPAKTASQYYTFSSYLWAPIKTHAFYVLILCPLHLSILNATRKALDKCVAAV